LSIRTFFDSDAVFIAFLAVFVAVSAIVLSHRDGKDLKVGLYAIDQVRQKKSPYINPIDPKRPIFRYAPGVTILEYPFFLTTRVVGPYQLEHTGPSVFAWFAAEMLALLGSGWFLYKLIPAASPSLSLRNLKISFVMALPLIIYEVINSQNKLIALFLILAAVFLFEKKKFLWSAILFNIALTIYVALLPFLFFFLIKDKRYLVSFMTAVLLVFLIIPSLVFGVDFNIYLIKEWMHSLQSFFSSSSYSSYADLRRSSQSIPSVVGRIFVSGHWGQYKDAISPVLIHVIIRVLSISVLGCSCFALWKNPKPAARGFSLAVFLILGLILPQYCIYYTWAYSFVFYFAVLNYISYPDVSRPLKRDLIILIVLLCVAGDTVGFHRLSYLSVLFWATIIFWAGLISVMLGRTHAFFFTPGHSSD